MLSFTTLYFLWLLGHGLASPVVISRDSVPAGFSFNGPAVPGDILELRIGLKQNNIDGLIEKLYDISTPSSSNYGKWLNKEEAAQFAAPSTDTTNAVTRWLKANNVSWSTLTPAGDWISISVSIEEANRLLDADYGVYTQTASGKKLTRTLSYSVPDQLVEHIEFIHPTTNFAILVSRGSKHVVSRSSNITSRDGRSSCEYSIIPSCLQEEYGIPSTPAPNSSSQLAVAAFGDTYASADDLEDFLIEVSTNIPYTTTFTLETVDGGENPQGIGDASPEGNVETQYTVGLANGIPVTYISTGLANPDHLNGFLDVMNYLLDQSDPPQVLAIGDVFLEDNFYGEANGEEQLAINLCNAYAQLTARGVSIVFASGDSGVSGENPCTGFIPTFPPTCPFVTAVGATQGVGTETAAPFTSGGFSSIFSQEPFQASAVSAYLSWLGTTYEGLYSYWGFGYPDVAFNGVDYNIILNEDLVAVSTTAASSASFGAVIALVNAELISRGYPVLGFLNPLIYSSPSAWTDIVSGSNPGCETNGFPATTGWDPVSGVGTPIYSELLAAALAAAFQ